MLEETCEQYLERALAERDRLKAVNTDLLTALGDAAALADSMERNRSTIGKAFQKLGRPDPWQVGWEPKIARLRAAIARAREAKP